MNPERLTNEEYLDNSSLFRIFRHSVDGHLKLHWHEFFELSFILSGTGTHILNGVPYPLSQGNMFLLTPADFHEIITDSKIELYNLIFSEQFISEELYMLLFHDETQALHHQFDTKLFNDILSGCERIWHENVMDEQGSHLIIRGEVERLLIYLMRELRREGGGDETAKKKHANAHIPTAIHQAILYIQHHFRDAISLSDVAKHVQLSPNYLSERFHMHTGVRFQTFVQDRRLNFAETLLSASDLPITEICYASGFNTLSHFERLFKQRKGQPPSDFRKHVRSKQQSTDRRM